jgi:hypothetical protein
MEQHEQAGAAGHNRRRGLRIHLTVFVFVNLLLLGVNLAATPQYWWFRWALLGWGAGVGLHVLLITLLPGGGRRRRLLRREDRKRQRQEALAGGH